MHLRVKISKHEGKNISINKNKTFIVKNWYYWKCHQFIFRITCQMRSLENVNKVYLRNTIDNIFRSIYIYIFI